MHNFGGGLSCTDNQLVGWVKIPQRPAIPKIDTRVTAAWIAKDQLQITNDLTEGSGASIQTVVADRTVFKQAGAVSGNTMILTTPAQCGSTDNALRVYPYNLAPYATLTAYGFGQNQRCQQLENITIAITNSYPDSGIDNTGDTAPTATTSNPDTGTCKITGDLDWLFCSLQNIASNAIDFLVGALKTLLYTPTSQIFTDQFQKSFNSFRNLGIALLIIAGLVMVISQAAGLEIFAAYTVRKALPRIILAMLGIALSWPLLQFIITFFNDIGIWANQLILATVNVDTGGAPLSSYSFGSVSILATVAGGALLFSTGIVMGLLGTVFLSLLIGFLVLALRQLIILACVLLAPLAIACWIFPGTQKLGHFWRDTLLTALAAFPIIMVLIGAGQAMSTIAAEAGNASGSGGAWKLLSVLSEAVPLFILPWALRLAGGAVGGLHAALTGSGFGKGIFGGIRNFQGRRFGERIAAAGSGHFFKPRTELARTANDAIWSVANLGQGGINPFRWRSNMREARHGNAIGEAKQLMEKSPEWQSILNDNSAIKAAKMIAQGRSLGEIDSWLQGNGDPRTKASMGELGQQARQSVITRALRASRVGSSQATQIASLYADAQSGTGWMYKIYEADEHDPETGQLLHRKGEVIDTQQAFRDMAKDIADVTGGDAAMTARVWGDMKGLGGRTRGDLFGAGFNAGYTQILNAAAARSRGEDAAGVDAAIDANAVLLEAFTDNPANAIMSGKPYSAEAVIETAADEMRRIAPPPNVDWNTLSAAERQTISTNTDRLTTFAAGILNAQRSGVYVSPRALSTVQHALDTAPPQVRAAIQREVDRMQRAAPFTPEDLNNAA